jgi:hypothetical protein
MQCSTATSSNFSSTDSILYNCLQVLTTNKQLNSNMSIIGYDTMGFIRAFRKWF